MQSLNNKNYHYPFRVYNKRNSYKNRENEDYYYTKEEIDSYNRRKYKIRQSQREDPYFRRRKNKRSYDYYSKKEEKHLNKKPKRHSKKYKKLNLEKKIKPKKKPKHN